jgi:hypothetical protein
MSSGLTLCRMKETSSLGVSHESMGTTFAGTTEMESPLQFIFEENRLSVRKWIDLQRNKYDKEVSRECSL